MSDSIVEKRILHIENDERLIHCLQEVLSNERVKKDWGFKVEALAACHMAEAKRRLIKNRENFDALIVDLMMPRTKAELMKLEESEKKRRDILQSLIAKTRDNTIELTEEVVRLRKQLDLVEKEIKSCVDMLGGYHVLKEWGHSLDTSGDKENPKSLKIPVVFWTARAKPEIREKCRMIVHRDYFAWLEKPVEDMEVVRTLVDLWRRGRRESSR